MLGDWKVLSRAAMVEHSFVAMAMEETQLPNGQVATDWPNIHNRDYVNAIVVNKASEALIIEGFKPEVGRITWQLIGGYLVPDEDPLTAVQRELFEETGYETKDWSYLGSFMIEPNQSASIGHFFCAQNVELVADPDSNCLEAYDLEVYELKWVPLKELRYGLLDGRLAAVSYATTVALAMLTVLK